MMNKIFSSKEYNALDILKLILAVLVMIIHSGTDKTLISPILRIAVPLFFIISSYFFFSKIRKLDSKKERNTALFHTVKRNLLLYLIWSVVQLPIVIFMRGYHHDFIPSGAWAIVRDILLGSGFTGSWYIVALVIGIVAVFLLSKKIPSLWLALLTLPLYILCCLTTNYGNLFDESSIVYGIGNGYYELTGLYIHTGFPVALFWVSLGKVLADKLPAVKTNILALLAVISGGLLMLERYFIVRLGSDLTDDCYFMLILFCPMIFLLVSRCTFTFTTRFRVRELSVLIYVTHGCIGRIVGYALKLVPMSAGLFEPTKLLGTLAVAVIVGILIIFIKERYRTSVLKYIC